MAMRFSEVRASVGKFIEVGNLDGMELGSRETTWLYCLCKMVTRGVPTTRMVVITKTASLTVGFLKTFFRDWFIYYWWLFWFGILIPSYTSLMSLMPIPLNAVAWSISNIVVLEVSGASTSLNGVKLYWWYSQYTEIYLEYLLKDIADPPDGPVAVSSCPYIISFIQVVDNLSSLGSDVVINLEPSEWFNPRRTPYVPPSLSWCACLVILITDAISGREVFPSSVSAI